MCGVLSILLHEPSPESRFAPHVPKFRTQPPQCVPKKRTPPKTAKNIYIPLWTGRQIVEIVKIVGFMTSGWPSALVGPSLAGTVRETRCAASCPLQFVQHSTGLPGLKSSLFSRALPLKDIFITLRPRTNTTKNTSPNQSHSFTKNINPIKNTHLSYGNKGP